MKCALSGTPGVGKTTVSKLLKEQGYHVLDLNGFIKEKGLWIQEDEDRGSLEVDIPCLKKAYDEQKNDHDIVEGHLSHHLSLSPTIVLRCAPRELKKRMKEKDWREKKIKENLEAEALDVILIEALEFCEDVYEIDTTHKNPEEVAICLNHIFKGDPKEEGYRPGTIDWSEKYFSER